MQNFSSGQGKLYRVRDNGKIGYINSKGTTKIKARFELGDRFSSGLAKVVVNGRFGFIDKSGNLVIRPLFDYAEAFSSGIAKVYLDSNLFYIDTTGQFLNPPGDIVGNLVNGSDYYIVSSKNNPEHFGIWSRKHNKLVLDTTFNQINRLPNGTTILITGDIKQQSIEGIDANGRSVFSKGLYSQIGYFNEGYAICSRQAPSDSLNAFGLIDSIGGFHSVNCKFPFTFLSEFTGDCARIGVFAFGKAPEKLNYLEQILNEPHLEGFVYRTGEIKLFDSGVFTSEMYEGRAFIGNEQSGYRLINKEAEIINSEVFDSYIWTFRSYIIVSKDGRYGAIDTKGNYIVKPIFSEPFDLPDENTAVFTHEGSYPKPACIKFVSISDTTQFKSYDVEQFVQGLNFGQDSGIYAAAYNKGRLTYWAPNGKIVWQEKKNRAVSNTKGKSIFCKGPGGLSHWDRKIQGFIKNPDLTITKPIDEYLIKNRLFNDVILLAYPKGLKQYSDADIYLINKSADNQTFGCQDGLLNALLQVKNSQGNWITIEEIKPSMCGNSYYDRVLPAGKFWRFSKERYRGAIKSTMRLVLGTSMSGFSSNGRKVIYSNEFEGYYNPAQLWRKLTWERKAIIDFYGVLGDG